MRTKGTRAEETVGVASERESRWFSYGKTGLYGYSTRDVDLNNLYAWNYNLLKFMGIWPEERKWNRSSSYLVLLPCTIMLCFACAPQTINLPMIAGDSDLVIENLSINITVMVSLIKTLTVWINGIRKHFRKLHNNKLNNKYRFVSLFN
ncbi:uncharacterized protein LOC122570530 [Bombus pyrosoma]|uniref:uncharacterized protein LOC122570530 n=1 Tax=Bombus pyrosoma TaxID=396416 RepID=UPI001CB8A86A|nr:uncharacterized protein LOC122570530 [Bombus pyrosoma]